MTDRTTTATCWRRRDPKETGAPPVCCAMPYTFESFDDRAVVVTLRDGMLVARETPLDDVSRDRVHVLREVS